MVEYRVLVDLDRDGYVHRATAQADPINRLPSPVQYKGLYTKAANSASTVTQQRTTTDYGVFVINAALGAGAGTGVVFGQQPTSGAVDAIAVTAGSTYTLKLWIKTSSFHSNTETIIRIYNQAGTQQGATSTFYPETFWSPQTLTFTASGGSTHVRIAVLKDAPYDATTLQVAGLMLVAGSSAPTAFNAGGGHYLDPITAYVRGLTFADGMERAYVGMPTPARCEILLHNENGYWLPENSGSPLFGRISKGMIVFVEALHLGTTYPLWRGTVASVTVSGDDSNPIVQIVAEDGMALINEAVYEPPLLTNARTGAALATPFTAGVVRYPYPGEWGILDAVGYGELDISMRLFEDIITEFDAGQTELAFVGDNSESGAGIGVQAYIAGLVGAEAGGRFFYDGQSGKYVFHDRHRDILQAGSYTTLVRTEVSDLRYAWGDDVINDVTLNYAPRRVGAAGTVMFSLADLPARFMPGQTRTFTASYRMADSVASVGGMDMIAPAKGTDIVALSEEGSNKTLGLLDMTWAYNVRVTFGAASAQVAITSSAPEASYLTTFQLRGTPLISDTRATVTAVDGTSIGDHGVHRRTIDAAALSDATFAQQYADYIVLRRAQPIGRIEDVTIPAHKSDALMTKALALGIGDFVEIDDSYLTNAQARYAVVGRAHALDIGLNRHDARLILQPVERQIFVILDDPTAELDSAVLAL